MAETKKLPQPMRPSGFGGRIFGVAMEMLSASNYRWVVKQLEPTAPRTYLEIGFGTGKQAQLVAARFHPAHIFGVDPSELMLATARKQLARFSPATAVDMRLGDDTLLGQWPPAPIDAIVASHSWQFWADPVTTLARIRALLAPAGRFVMVIRSHISEGVQKWIPNPITKAGNELEGLRAALATAGFRIIVDEKLRTGSQGIVAVIA
ncbi:MAG: class I SAM-dependent methyltransferase [Alphaproteobacteria bacterium]|nr:class I SAM-dependent methyltransferase [Alphaproteobacteria bacterium]MBL6936242.1 class I SAM-dependent methyltransferase [Alphaproteobacteria bacterium]MBL7098707.1 class I SAM-dependent methyltransferase [Alphaproteobacteria bacterium]